MLRQFYTCCCLLFIVATAAAQSTSAHPLSSGLYVHGGLQYNFYEPQAERGYGTAADHQTKFGSNFGD